MTAFMTTLSDITPGDIWLAYVTFASKPETGKVRPILVVALAEDGSSVVAAKITTSPTWPESEYVFIPDWEACGLRKPSYVQMAPLFELSLPYVLRDEPLGRLSKSLLDSIIDRLNAN